MRPLDVGAMCRGRREAPNFVTCKPGRKETANPYENIRCLALDPSALPFLLGLAELLSSGVERKRGVEVPQ